MATHYQILGVHSKATEQEIKIAFRKLAKQHHPDVNPMGKEAFARALLAYETLTDPQSRRLYDLSIGINAPTQNPRSEGGFDPQKKQKEWSFSEEELKRRQYYQEYYKTRQYAHPEVKTEVKKAYSDYRFLLFAMPLAIALLMFIFFIYEPREHTSGTASHGPQESSVSTPPGVLRLGDRPYSSYFGDDRVDTSAHNTLSISNYTDYETVVVVLRKKDSAFVQSLFLNPSSGVTVSNVPDGDLLVKFVVGLRWNPNREVYNRRLLGGFDSIIMYGRYAELPALLNKGDVNGVKVLITTSQPQISEAEFFQKKKK